MKKLESMGIKLSKEEQRQIRGGDAPPGCIEEYGYSCALDNYPGGTCCANLHCEENATKSGTICMAD